MSAMQEFPKEESCTSYHHIICGVWAKEYNEMKEIKTGSKRKIFIVIGLVATNLVLLTEIEKLE